jgi:hypothetical protein
LLQDLEQECHVLKEDMGRGLDVVVREVPIVWVDRESTMVELGGVGIDESNDCGISQEWNTDYPHPWVLVP